MFRDEYGKKTFFGILQNEAKLFKHRFQKYGALSFQAIKEAAARNNSRVRKIANNVFDERHQEMMLIKDIENAQGSDPAAFFPAAGTNADAAAQRKETKTVTKSPPVTSKGVSKSSPPTATAKSVGSAPEAKKKLPMGPPPGHVHHISPPKGPKPKK